MSTCEHPQASRRSYHDSSILCDDCGCVIEQFGKPIEDPSPLFSSPFREQNANDSSSSTCSALALIREARDLLDGEIGDSDPIGSDWDVDDYPVIGAFQKLNQAESILQQNSRDNQPGEA